MRPARLAPLLLAALLATGCLQSSPGGDPRTPAPGGPAPPADASLVAANAEFAMRLSRTLAAQAPDANLFLSPLGVSMAFAMAYESASGEARAEMARAFGFDALAPGGLAGANRALLDNLSARREVALDVANAFWMRDSFAPRVNAGYVETLRTSYRSEVETADFSDPATVDRINAWASESTRGKVPRVLDRIGPGEVALLLDAVYFQGNWTHPFRPHCTRDAPFARQDGSVSTVRMMCG
ncbi:MAG TPA: serpin family protein, partial [Candidatus Thermoplasmatota archaeon]|nr:serpin family protein [Candidatus Thermoplasmatota archaeon]